MKQPTTSPPPGPTNSTMTILGRKVSKDQLRRWRPALIAGAVVVAGLTVWGLVWLILPQGPGSSFGRNALFLLSQAPVQKELSVYDEQLTKITALREAEAYTVEEDARKLSVNDTNKRRDARSWTIEKKLSKILDSAQFTRLRQIHLQQRGTQAWTDPEVIKALRLSATQKQEISTAQRESQEKMRALFPRGGGNAPAANPQEVQKQRKEMEALRKSGQEQLLEILTDQQRSQWEEMLGAPFKGELRSAGGGGGRRGNRLP